MRFRFVCALCAAVIAAALLPGVAVHAQQGERATITPRTAPSSVQTVSFRIVPVILMVVGSDGRPRQLWSNLRRVPTASELAAVRVRTDGPEGPDVPVTPALRVAVAGLAGDAAWGRPGLVWSAS
jgi:hypothetical protein